MQNSSELETLRSNFNDWQEDAEYHQDKFMHIQAELVDKIEKYKGLNNKYVMIESQLAKAREEVMVESKRKKVEVVRADLMTKKNAIRVLRVKLYKEQEMVNHLSENMEASKKHENQIDTNNNALN